jgi:hypothetical protein
MEERDEKIPFKIQNVKNMNTALLGISCATVAVFCVL